VDICFLSTVVSKGTIVIPNMASVLSEEGQWKFPHEFNPENFLDDQGEFVKPEAFIPFSVGKWTNQFFSMGIYCVVVLSFVLICSYLGPGPGPRVCLGEGLARMELFLVLVTLLRRFQFIWPKNAGEPDYRPVFGLTISPQPYNLEVHFREKERERA